MYVAATRARDLLVISGYAGDLKDKKAWGLLDGGLAGVEELPECPAEPAPGSPCAPPPRKKRSVVKPEEAAKGREAIRRRMAAAARATALHESVTSLARKSGEAPEWAKGGLGLWGSEVHVMLRGLAAAWPAAGAAAGPALPEEEKLVRMAHDVLAAAGRNPAAAGALAGHVGAIVRSSFWARAMRSSRRLYEVPFSVKAGSGDPDYAALRAAVGPVPSAGGRPVAAAEDAPVFLSGAIDLVFREEGGWIIADYKTDRLPAVLDGASAADRDGALAALVDHYRPQVALYARFWARLTGEEVKESGLYFTALDRWVPIGPSGSEPSAPGR
jgi:ATP-dependent helicase/nuclease subunit A